MPTPYDVPAHMLIERLAAHLKNNVESIRPPEWAPFVKTGVFAERPPENPDWWYIRCASILRKLYMKGPIGVDHLRQEYGGRKDRGTKPEHTRKGSGAIVRNALKQLEKAGLVRTEERKGRVITPEGRRLLDLISTDLKKELEKRIPELKKY
ncbi:MAG: 30S ribosomal protein S19e [Nitrososphaerota archaeon]|nr:30S ribosomal protein S19e [Candidatus Bathyarchaeota archaeon]MDW8048820.1 30S ribosomal protein S19e [Nitrososphaerota archaeon]